MSTVDATQELVKALRDSEFGDARSILDEHFTDLADVSFALGVIAGVGNFSMRLDWSQEGGWNIE